MPCTEYGVSIPASDAADPCYTGATAVMLSVANPPGKLCRSESLAFSFVFF
jgi:hypothetical protein